MTTLQKILLSIAGIIVIIAFGFIIYKQNEISTNQKLIETSLVEQKELLDNITRASSKFTSKDDLEKFIQSNDVNLKAIKDDLDKLSANLNTVNVVTVKSNSQVLTNVPSTNTTPNPISTAIPNANDPFGFMSNTQHLTLNEKFQNLNVPIGTVSFSAWQEKPWSVDIAPREYKVINVIGTDENQKNYVYNKFSVNVNNKNYDIKISKAETQQELPTAKFTIWNPRLFLGVDGGINVHQVKGEFTPNISLGIASYGKFLKNPDLSILQLGIGVGTVSQKPQFTITPIMYNFGQHVPFMNNSYIGPSVHVGSTGDISVLGGIHVGL